MKQKWLLFLCLLACLLSGCGLQKAVVVQESQTLQEINDFLIDGFWQQKENAWLQLQYYHRFIIGLSAPKYADLQLSWRQIEPELARLSRHFQAGRTLETYMRQQNDFCYCLQRFLQESQAEIERER